LARKYLELLCFRWFVADLKCFFNFTLS
jgi:hypothetical protein